MSKSQSRLSRTLSLILRHDPGVIGLILDDHGWARIDELLDCLNRKGKRVDRDLLEKIVAESDKQRFRISKDGKRVRANQGHSILIELNFEEKDPPQWLYHGTASRFMNAIEREGLQKQSRHHVQLSGDKDTARKAGARHGKPVVLEVAAQLMVSHGHQFFQSENGVWLVDEVPPDYLNQRFT
ncbi:RNA 2'-phosphotransferase [bacterium]|jgi:putative RNA 2'-phosphotransferase|nr:RNA 2'-phosphotransferase [bacterium]